MSESFLVDFVVDTEQMQRRGMPVANMNGSFNHIVADVIGRSVADSRLDPGPRYRLNDLLAAE